MPKDYVIGATVVASENEEILSVSEKGIENAQKSMSTALQIVEAKA